MNTGSNYYSYPCSISLFPFHKQLHKHDLHNIHGRRQAFQGYRVSTNLPSLLSMDMYTEAKRCFATHDEDNDYFNMRKYIILIACVYIQQFNFIQ